MFAFYILNDCSTNVFCLNTPTSSFVRKKGVVDDSHLYIYIFVNIILFAIKLKRHDDGRNSWIRYSYFRASTSQRALNRFTMINLYYFLLSTV